MRDAIDTSREAMVGLLQFGTKAQMRDAVCALLDERDAAEARASAMSAELSCACPGRTDIALGEVLVPCPAVERAERAEAESAAESLRLEDAIQGEREAHESTRDQLAAAQRDVERLDFLGRAPDNIRFIVYPMQPFEGDWCCVQALEHYRNAPGGFRTLREAIDDAM